MSYYVLFSKVIQFLFILIVVVSEDGAGVLHQLVPQELPPSPWSVQLPLSHHLEVDMDTGRGSRSPIPDIFRPRELGSGAELNHQQRQRS